MLLPSCGSRAKTFFCDLALFFCDPGSFFYRSALGFREFLV
jgi:hypothetical protein